MSEPSVDAQAMTVPYRYPGTVGAGTIAPDHGDLAPGDSSGVTVAVAGRLMRNRPQGKVAFAELRDWTGSIQLFALNGETEAFEQFSQLSLGDWIGARGEIIRTKRGEISVRVANFELLAKARLGFGDKWRGINDIDVRHRQREVDLWANPGVREGFLLRSKGVAAIRRQLDGAGFVEVETPVLQPLAGGANARPFETYFHALHSPYYLRIATELHLKRLVVGGFERVYELGRILRNEGLSPRHNPEFTMLEAYQAYADYLDMAELIESIVVGCAEEILGTAQFDYEGRPLDLTRPWRRATVSEVIAEVTGYEATLEMGASELRALAASLDVELHDAWGAVGVLAEIYDKTTEHQLWDPVHVMDYPEEVSPLSRRHRSKPGLVERLTPIIAGREIGEAYSELVDPDDQRARFVAQAAARAGGDEEAMSLDEDFLRALSHGMPPTGGIGIGIDRLMMLLTGRSNIREVILFPALRPEVRDLLDDGEHLQPDGDNAPL